MGNLPCIGSKDEAWKRQNTEMVENPLYKFVNLAKGGSLIDAYITEGPQKVVEIAENELSRFFYNENGNRHRITELEYLRWRWKFSQKSADFDDVEKATEETLKAQFVEDHFNKYVPHEACWDLQKRGGVGETPLHLLCLMDSPVHFEVARVLLKLYPNLALDVYEGEEYFGESALHIAVVIGDCDLVQILVEAGANVNQRATGTFFLPEDQKKRYTGQTNYEGYAYYGEYPLAFAACLGKMEIYEYLIEHGADPDLQDSFGNTILHMLVISNQREMYRYAARHHRLPASTTIKNSQNLTPLTLACKLGRHAIFKEMIDIDSIEFWSFSTTQCTAHPLHALDTVGADGSTNWNSALMIIVNGDKDDHLEMLDGGVMRQLVIEKWKTFAKRRFMIRLIFAIIHILLFSVCVYTRPIGHALLEYRGSVDAIRYTSEVYVSLSCFITVAHDVKEIFTQGLTIFFSNCTHAPAKVVYLISCLLVLASIPFRFAGLHYVEDVLVILAAPSTWFFMLFFARGYILTGPFVTVIYKMCVGDLFRFGIIYVIFLSAFTQVFFFLYRDVTPAYYNPDFDKFLTFPETLLKMFQMTFGEFKYAVFNLSHYSPLTKLIFGLFMILVPILLLNMFIAMMGNTHMKIISKSTKEWWKQWAKIVVVLETGISRKNLIEYQKAYSVRLANLSPAEEGSQPPLEERALVVIRTCLKSRAKRRKEAVLRWKTVGQEVMRQLHLKTTQRQQFELKEPPRKGHLLDEARQTSLSSTVTQMAWMRDIDFTKCQTFLTDQDSVHSSHLSPQSADLSKTPQHLPNGFKQNDLLSSRQDDVGNMSEQMVSKKATNLFKNKVSPMLLPTYKKEETTFSDSSDELVILGCDPNIKNMQDDELGHQVQGYSLSSATHGSLNNNNIVIAQENHITTNIPDSSPMVPHSSANIKK